MGQICSFSGVYVYMYPLDHNPPHFHAYHAEHEVRLRIPEWTVLDGGFPRNKLRELTRWATLRQTEIEANWERCEAGENPLPIDPP